MKLEITDMKVANYRVTPEQFEQLCDDCFDAACFTHKDASEIIYYIDFDLDETLDSYPLFYQLGVKEAKEQGYKYICFYT
jgi:hypothetical protein